TGRGTGLAVEIFSDGTYLHAHQSILGKNPHLNDTPGLRVSYRYDTLPSELKPYVWNPLEIDYQNRPLETDTIGKGAEGMQNLAVALLPGDGEGSVVLLSKEVNFASPQDSGLPEKQRVPSTDHGRAFDFANSRTTTNEGRGNAEVTEGQWYKQMR